uniref:MFS transporter n=1 Tax=Lentilactobacillus hilgardii TaxID=1588 RepID=UPI00403FC09C
MLRIASNFKEGIKMTAKNKSLKIWWIFTAISIFSFMSTLTSSVVNIAMPVMSRAMDVTTTQINWVASSYLVMTCMLLLPFGKLGDLYGKVSVFKIGTVIFTISSLLCGINFGFAFLLICRGLQAIGASMTLSNNAGIITEIFPPKKRGLALGSFSSVVALGGVVGPGLGGLILAHLSWNYIFWINIPLGIFAIIIGQLFLPKTANRRNQQIDYLGLVSFGIMMGTLFIGLLWGQEIGFASLPFILLMIVTIILLTVFIFTERRFKTPVVNLDLFRNVNFSLNLIATILVYALNFVVNIIEPLYLQENRLISPEVTGLIMMSFPIIQIIIAPLAGTLSDHMGDWQVYIAGIIILIIGQVGLATVSHETSISTLCIWLGFIGLGNGIFQAPNNVMVMEAVPKNQLGVTSGLLGLSRNIGMTVGTIFSSVLLFAGINHTLGYTVHNYPTHAPTAFITGMQLTFIATAIVFLIFLIGNVTARIVHK